MKNSDLIEVGGFQKSIDKINNTVDNKARFFALYQFSHVCFEGISNSVWNTERCTVFGYFINNDDEGKIYVKDASALMLYPLSKIKEEDVKYICIDFAGINENRYNQFSFEEKKSHVLETISDFTDTNVVLVDYLRFKGYALPFMGFSVDELVEMKWIKLLD